jgi:hypothetical protein
MPLAIPTPRLRTAWTSRSAGPMRAAASSTHRSNTGTALTPFGITVPDGLMLPSR